MEEEIKQSEQVQKSDSEITAVFGDYSSYSAEYDEINDPDAVIGGEETVEEALNNEE